MTGEMILAVDPGRGKTGWAFCSSHGELLLSGITPTREMEAFCAILAERDWKGLGKWAIEGAVTSLGGNRLGRVVIGEGTGSSPIRALLEGAGLSPEGVDESYSTLRGRELYWNLHPPRGLRKIIPLSLQVPPRDVDDLAAWALALSVTAS